MPTRFVGIHLALAALIAIFGLGFLADPCGGGGDLCLGGAVGLMTLGVAAGILVGVVIWWGAHRASPLLVLGSAVVTVAGYSLLQLGSSAPAVPMLGLLLIVTLGLAGVAMAGAAVATRRIERLVAVGMLVAVALFGGEGGVAVLVVGLVPLAAAWLRDQTRGGASAIAAGVHSRPHGEDREE